MLGWKSSLSPTKQLNETPLWKSDFLILLPAKHTSPMTLHNMRIFLTRPAILACDVKDTQFTPDCPFGPPVKCYRARRQSDTVQCTNDSTPATRAVVLDSGGHPSHSLAQYTRTTHHAPWTWTWQSIYSIRRTTARLHAHSPMHRIRSNCRNIVQTAIEYKNKRERWISYSIWVYE